MRPSTATAAPSRAELARDRPPEPAAAAGHERDAPLERAVREHQAPSSFCRDFASLIRSRNEPVAPAGTRQMSVAPNRPSARTETSGASRRGGGSCPRLREWPKTMNAEWSSSAPSGTYTSTLPKSVKQKTPTSGRSSSAPRRSRSTSPKTEKTKIRRPTRQRARALRVAEDGGDEASPAAPPRDRQRRQLALDPGELLLRPRRVHLVEPVGELLQRQPARDGVLAERDRGALALGVGGADVRQPAHASGRL